MQETAPAKKGFAANSTGLIAFVVVVLILISLGTYVAVKKDNGNQNPTPTLGQPGEISQMTNPMAPKTIVYGTWAQSGSEIKAVDLSNGKYQVLANLPVDIKKVTVASPDTLIYINQTNYIRNQIDQGKEIAVYSLSQGKNTTTVPAAEGFAIDDYVVSPNKNYIATWELAFAEGSSKPRGGRSRVYTINLSNPSVKNLIYDEEANDLAIHYPRAILDNGKVFLDTYLPNDPNGGRGYAYGMSVADFDGQNKKDLDKMKNGTYGSQPYLYTDGSKLVFVGYDGEDGAAIKSYRKAILTPNTVETLDVNSLERTKLPNLPNTNIYSAVIPDGGADNLLVTSDTGFYKYSLADNTPNKIDTANNSSFITTLTPEKSLLGIIDDSESSKGNLSEGYYPAFKKFIFHNNSTVQDSDLPLPDALMQYITIVPPGYFGDPVSAASGPEDVVGNPAKKKYFINLYSSQNQEKDNLQLYTFFLKSDLAPKRLSQQSEPGTPPIVTGTPDGSKPKCKSLAQEQCKAKGYTPGTTDFKMCETNLKVNYRIDDACYDSPLYLYGKQGQKVKVNVNTYVYNTDPSYQDGYDVTLLEDGKMLVNGTTTDSIKYDYNPGIKVNPPSYGRVTSLKGLNNVLNNYARSLGLNQKETQDLINFAKNKITSPFVFVSFFNQKDSEEILPLSFSLKPDNYLNIVLYFKQYNARPEFTPAAPVFSTPLNRSGFTAVEISSIVE